MKTIIKKRRWSSRRELLLELLQKEGGHVDAEALYRKAKELCPTIGLSTVYRNLRLFKDLGLVKELQLKAGHAHYEPVKRTEHGHFICVGCDKVMEFTSSLMIELRRELEGRFGVRLEGLEIRAEGLCPECLKARKDNDA